MQVGPEAARAGIVAAAPPANRRRIRAGRSGRPSPALAVKAGTAPEYVLDRASDVFLRKAALRAAQHRRARHRTVASHPAAASNVKSCNPTPGPRPTATYCPTPRCLVIVLLEPRRRRWSVRPFLEVASPRRCLVEASAVNAVTPRGLPAPSLALPGDRHGAKRRVCSQRGGRSACSCANASGAPSPMSHRTTMARLKFLLFIASPPGGFLSTAPAALHKLGAPRAAARTFGQWAACPASDRPAWGSTWRSFRGAERGRS